jgi:23S rRNA pseudouridine1911/1915/1917 synthase
MRHTAKNDTSILEALGSFYPGASKTTLRSWLKEGRIFVNNLKIVRAGHPLREGEAFEFKTKVHTLSRNLRILYEDNDIVVVDKPPGLLSVATESQTEHSVHSHLKNHYYPKRVFPVHRLDQDTSGVLLFALNERARDQLKKTFESHNIDRAYVALVEGEVAPQTGTWENYLYEDKNYIVHPTDDPQKGRLAITHYTNEHIAKNCSWLNLKLQSGRKNQIRVQCQLAGHPVLGDKKYGSQTNPLRRLALHAYHLTFAHPITNQKMTFEVPPPTKFFEFMKRKR